MKMEVKKILRAISLISILALMPLISCRPARPVPAGAVEFTDCLGRRLSLRGEPRRIVSFAPSLTEMVYALGGQDRLVGVTAWCNHPPQAGDKPSVGDFSSPNWERIAALKPDLVILVAGERSAILARLEALGIPSAAFRSEGVADVLGETLLMGGLLGRKAAAESLAASMRARLDSLDSKVEKVPTARRPRVFAEISARPLMTGSDQSFLGQLIALAGGANIAGELPQPYAAINPELVALRRPDVILVLHPGASAGEVGRRLGWSSIPAVRYGRIVTGLDLDLLMRPGPRLAEAALRLHHVLYPD